MNIFKSLFTYDKGENEIDAAWQMVKLVRQENVRLTKIIEEFQKKEYIVLKHDDDYYKCYKLENNNELR